MSSSCTRAARRHCSPTRAFSASELLMADPLPLSGGGSTLPLRWKLRRDLSRATDSSCPGLTRASTPFFSICQDVDGRDKPGHDDAEKDAAPPFTLPWRGLSGGGSTLPLRWKLRRDLGRATDSSCPGLTRASTPYLFDLPRRGWPGQARP